jgi:cell division protein FtsB
MARRRSKKRVPRGRFLLRWLGVGTLAFLAFLYWQPLRSYLSTRDAVKQQSDQVHELRAQKLRLERRLAESDTAQAVTREARRLGYVEPGERLYIVKGIRAWRNAHEHPVDR